MTKREEQLIRDYAPRFLARSKHIDDEILGYLVADGLSVLTDSEWEKCGEAIEKFCAELDVVRKLVEVKLEMVEPDENEQLAMYIKASEELKKFEHM